MGKVCRAAVVKRSRACSDHSRIGHALEMTVQASFSQLQVAVFEGSLARKLPFHIFNFQILREVSYEMRFGR